MKDLQVHDGVDSQVKSQTPSAPGLSLGVSDLSIEEGQGMMVPVHEDNWTFSDDQEESVSEFGGLRHHKHPAPVSSKRVGVVIGVVAVRSWN